MSAVSLAEPGMVPATAGARVGRPDVCFVVPSLQAGGAERVVATLAAAMTRIGRTAHVLTLGPADGDFYPLAPGVGRTALGMLAPSAGLTSAVANNVARIRAMRRAVRRLRPHAVISFGERTSVIARFATLGLPVRMIAAERTDPRAHDLGPVWNTLRRLGYRLADELVVQTPSVREWAVGVMPPERVHVIPNPLDRRGAVRVEAGPRETLVVAVGRMTQEKGFDLLLDAFSRVARRRAGWRLCILGEGPLRPALEHQAAALGIADVVEMPGVVPDPGPWLARAAVFALPSRFEGFPNALLEAMAAGCAVVACDCPSGPRHIVRDGENGLLVAPEDPASLAAGIDLLMDDEPLRARLGRSATAVADEYDVERVAAQWSAVAFSSPHEGGQAVHSQHATEVASGERFEFGANWARFLAHLDEERIAEAERSLKAMLETDSLAGKRFLDAGSGSGLFSLAARRLGAAVHSFDYDPASVACTRELRRRYYPDDGGWTIDEGSVLDAGYLATLGTFDVVYSWGVLHHTGRMWEALGNVAPLVAPGGQLFIAIYNDQGRASRRWRTVKRLYNRAPRPLKTPVVAGVAALWEARASLVRAAQGRNPLPFRDWAERKRQRGMSPWHDFVDWVGGYPFEVARPDEIFDFFRERGFTMRRLVTVGSGHGCNEFVFQAPGGGA